MKTFLGQKAPRQYAHDIACLPTVEERRAALENVPTEYAELVKTYLVDWYTMKRKKRSHEQRIQKMREALK